MPLKRIRLELARDRDFPEGSRHHGYEFVAPIDTAGHVIRKPGGAWAFHYDVLGDADDDETGYRFGDHTFRPGDDVTLKEHDDTLRTFRVVALQDVD